MKERNNNSNTVVQNDFNGWTAETTENYGSYDWKITTMKQSNGKIATIAIARRAGKSNNFLTFETFTPNITKSKSSISKSQRH